MKSFDFIRSNRRLLVSSPEFYNVDSVQMAYDPDADYKAKVLIVFPSTVKAKGQSITASVINDFVVNHCPGVFVDFAFIPDRSELPLYDKYGMPYALGTSSWLDASHFDFVGFSISVIHEIVAIPWIVSSFARCDRPIPLSWSDRKDLKCRECPVLYAGGISSVYSDILFGALGDGRVSYLDFIQLGDIGCADRLWGLLRPDMTIQGVVESAWRSGLDMIYQPQAYHVEIESLSGKILENTKVNPLAPDFVSPYFDTVCDNGPLGSSFGIIRGSGVNAGLSTIYAADGCGRSGSCNFCAEGWYSGGFREHSRSEINRLAEESIKYTAGCKSRVYSYNTDYLTDFKALVLDMYKRFPAVSFNNPRLDELGRDADSMAVMSLIGMKQASAPIEGVSPRIREGLLNKNIDQSAMDSYFDNVIRAGSSGIKVRFIFTGWEEDCDWQWLLDYFVGRRKRASEMGFKLPIRFIGTGLVQYPLTPMYYAARRAAKVSYDGGFWIPPAWVAKYTDENGIRIVYNGFKYSTFVEQAILDLGRSLTWWLQKYIVSRGQSVYNLRPLLSPAIEVPLMSLVDDRFFEGRDPDRTISICHRIRLKLRGALYSQARGIFRDGLCCKPTPMCFKTHPDAKVKCAANAMSSDPFTVYSDVKWTDDGLRGDLSEVLNGCTACSSVDDKMRVLGRTIKSTVTIKSFSLVRKVEAPVITRFRLYRSSEFECVNPRATAFEAVSALLRSSDKLVSLFDCVMPIHSAYGQSDSDTLYLSYGSMLVDVVWKSSDVFNLLADDIVSANKYLKSVRFEGVRVLHESGGIPQSALNVFKVYSTLPLSLWVSAAANYKGDIYVKNGLSWGFTTDGELRSPLVKSSAPKCLVGVFCLPVKYNPWNYLRGFFRSQNVRLNRLVNGVDVECVTTVAHRRGLLCTCRDELCVEDLSSGKVLPVGESCLLSSLLCSID